jgi:hypothetical protein
MPKIMQNRPKLLKIDACKSAWFPKTGYEPNSHSFEVRSQAASTRVSGCSAPHLEDPAAVRAGDDHARIIRRREVKLQQHRHDVEAQVEIVSKL